MPFGLPFNNLDNDQNRCTTISATYIGDCRFSFRTYLRHEKSQEDIERPNHFFIVTWKGSERSGFISSAVSNLHYVTWMTLLRFLPRRYVFLVCLQQAELEFCGCLKDCDLRKVSDLTIEWRGRRRGNKVARKDCTPFVSGLWSLKVYVFTKCCQDVLRAPCLFLDLLTSVFLLAMGIWIGNKTVINYTNYRNSFINLSLKPLKILIRNDTILLILLQQDSVFL